MYNSTTKIISNHANKSDDTSANSSTINTSKNNMQIVIISGLAGAGKSTALKILEDNDYYCIDNLPPPLLLPLINIYLKDDGICKLAVSVDTRSKHMLEQVPNLLADIHLLTIHVKLIYLEATANTLVRRFSETRRKHPLAHGNKTIIDCVKEEQDILFSIAKIAYRIDTSALSANSLRKLIKQTVGADYAQLTVVVQSFGFKYGIPLDADFVFDSRCLPNPYYVENIKDFTGLEAPIIEFLAKEPKATQMIANIHQFIQTWLPEFSLDNRSYVTIAIGCTGGKHRSVYIAEQIANKIANNNYRVLTRHRELN